MDKVIVQVTVLQGADLAAKDRNFLGRKTSSDPYCQVFKQGSSTMIGQTQTVFKSLNPEWPKQPFVVEFQGKECKAPHIVLHVFDHDELTSDDAMGSVTIRVPAKNCTTQEWYDIPPDSAKNATGRLLVELNVTVVYTQRLIRGNQFPLDGKKQLQVGLAWDMLPGRKGVDLDVSCVAISKEGTFLKDDTVYYGNQANSNESVVHSGDEQVGDDDGDDEKISLDLKAIPDRVLCMYILLTVATPGMRISDVESTTLRVYDVKQRCTLCRFTPSQKSDDATAMFMVRIARVNPTSNRWVLAIMEDTHPTARDFGPLLPYFKSYTRDLIPTITVDPTERVAIMQKGGSVRLTDYTKGGTIPERLMFGLAWDITDGVTVDFDASAVCLDAHLNAVDVVYFDHLKSDDGAIVHFGDEEEGGKAGDDEKMEICLGKVNPTVEYISFVINSYSGQELDDVDRASCHLFDPATNTDMATYAMSNAESLDGHTALIVACLYRGSSGHYNDWYLHIISEASTGKVVKENIGDLKSYLERCRPTVPEEASFDFSVESTMPDMVPIEEMVPEVEE